MPIKTVTIERLVYGGSGLGRTDGKVVFIPFTLPGERVKARIEESKRHYDKGLLLRILAPSPRRIPAPCPHFGRCGGCQWQHIAYQNQLSFKEDIFRETLARIAHVAGEKILPILPSPAAFGYRNRVRLHVKGGRIGFFAAHSYEIVEIEDCKIAHYLINRIIKDIKDALPLSSLQKLAGIEIMVSPEEVQGVLILHTGRPLSQADEDTIRLQSGRIPDIKKCVVQGPGGLPAQMNFGKEDSLKLFVPEGDGLTYFLFPGVFAQVNTSQNDILITKVMEWADISSDHKALDLFCGMGNFTLPLARKAKEVTGIEAHRLSVKNALFNKTINRLDNITFLQQEVAAGIDMLIRDKQCFDLILLDPPRQGCRDIIKRLPFLRPSRILYISCDPATLARDITHLRAEGFDLVRSQPLDMFPQTYHIESLSLFTC
ncbi:MAG: 23S rRNA (uracil(1939)-C(5))-methyltransferase RlmD [Thermodesulfobacteriota bacterium]